MGNSVHTQNNKSQFHNTVRLYEWWLTWAYNQNHEKRLAIAGYTSRDKQALRVFSSAPILKRHDVYTLETTDGVTVMILGYINITRTAENGFPPEMISNFFLFGFPLHWEACSELFLAQGSDSNGVLREDASFRGFGQANEHINEMTNTRANASPVSTDPKLDQDHAICMNREGSGINIDVGYITSARAAKGTDHRKASDVEKDNILKEKTAIKDARLAGKKTSTDVLREDASLKGCSQANEDKTEKINRSSFCPASVEPKLDQDLTVSITREDSKKKSTKAVRYISTASGAKDIGYKSTSAFKKGRTKKEKNATKKANTAGKKTCDVVSREDASLKCSIKANKEKHERINGGANVSSANADAKLDKKDAVRYITRSCGSKKTDHNKSAVVEKENVLTEKAATKEVSVSELKTKRRLKYGSPVALQVNEVTSIVSPESSSIKKSRSGRLLLPTLEYWRNQTAVYGVDHQVIGIKDIISRPSKVEVTPEPKKAEGKSK